MAGFWRPAHSITTLRNQFNLYKPNRNMAADGIIGDAAHARSQSYHNPDANSIVRAVDITHDPARGMDINVITDQLVASGDYRILEIIANRLYWNRNNPRWVPYLASNINPHTSHFHLSVIAPSAGGDDGRPWKLPIFGSVPIPLPTPTPTPAPGTLPAPAFPLPAGYYYGPLTGPAQSISGQYRTDRQEWRDGLRRWQQRMKDRQWAITPDGLYGPQTASVAKQFQATKGLRVDGLVGPVTWAAAWTAPLG